MCSLHLPHPLLPSLSLSIFLAIALSFYLYLLSLSLFILSSSLTFHGNSPARLGVHTNEGGCRRSRCKEVTDNNT